ARMLEVELELAQDPQQRADRLRAIVELKLTRLADAAGAFENVAQLVALEPSSREQRDQLAALARQIGAEERLAELLSTIADGSADRQVALSLVLDAAAVKQDALADRPGAIELYARVLAEATDRELALTAARQLDGLL